MKARYIPVLVLRDFRGSTWAKVEPVSKNLLSEFLVACDINSYS